MFPREIKYVGATARVLGEVVDRNRFLEIAPRYYAVAIADFFSTHGNGASQKTIMKDYFGDDDSNDPDSRYNYIEKNVLFDRAVDVLLQLKMIEVTTDDFGPPIFETSTTFSTTWHELKKDKTTPFYKHSIDESWLRSALLEINREYDRLGIKENDFEKPELEWEPLPLDRNTSELQEVTKKLDEVIEHVRSDNGYGATLPEEKSYVLDSLTTTAQKLEKNDTISWGYLQKHAFEPLKTVLRRFKDSATGAIATGLRTALEAWVKSQGIEALNHLWKIFWS